MEYGLGFGHKYTSIKAMSKNDGRIRKNVTVGSLVQITLKQDKKIGQYTKGIVEELLTEAAKHPQGIRVRLKSGQVGRIKKILSTKNHRVNKKTKLKGHDVLKSILGG